MTTTTTTAVDDDDSRRTSGRLIIIRVCDLRAAVLPAHLTVRTHERLLKYGTRDKLNAYRSVLSAAAAAAYSLAGAARRRESCSYRGICGIRVPRSIVSRGARARRFMCSTYNIITTRVCVRVIYIRVMCMCATGIISYYTLYITHMYNNA